MKNPKVLDIYSDYLIATFKLATATGLSEVLGGALSHDQISRFLGQRLFHQQDYWKCVKPIVRQVQNPTGIINIDDTIEHKPHSTENDIIAWHWDHSKKPKAGLVKGINILNFQYHVGISDNQNICIPVAYEIVKKTEVWFDKKSGKTKKRSPIKKNAMVRERLRILHFHNKIPFEYVMWDSWFSSKDNLGFVHYELQKHFIGAIKGNRRVALNSPEDNLARKYYRVDELDFQETSTYTVWLKGLDFPVTLCKQVFTNKDGSKGELYLITNDLTLSDQGITTTYDKRWDVEVFHKSLKQNAGLEKSPTKNEITQSNHIFAAMIAWTKLELLSIRDGTNHFALKNKLYINAVKLAFEQLQQLKRSQLRLHASHADAVPHLG